ncbi:MULTISPECIES: ATP-binding protein [Nocardiopsidaceae]|uniref:ATP-binding protein n=1 Tax=Streptomonospora nanhaiensis TaxID=1323731 RepID=A0ABY6YKZ5_9ACTN|nr:ATP-binding protein [Streptomonospora nanhaiensis]WAE73015.1 ATP-binding protein [Streptomonospora nanhaiensis]
MRPAIRIVPNREPDTGGSEPLPRRVTDPDDRAPMVLDRTCGVPDCHALAVAGRPEQAAVLRRRIATVLPPATADTAQYLVSELFNNAITHSRSGDEGGHVTVTVHWFPDRVQLKVIDQGPRGEAGSTPHMRPLDLEREGGLGLRLVHVQAARWGTFHDRNRTTVWFELDRPQARI